MSRSISTLLFNFVSYARIVFEFDTVTLLYLWFKFNFNTLTVVGSDDGGGSGGSSSSDGGGVPWDKKPFKMDIIELTPRFRYSFYYHRPVI